MITAGIDIGSTITKILIKDGKEILAAVNKKTGAEQRKFANRIMANALRSADLDLDDVQYIVATGYGRINVPFADKRVTEIKCHMRGVSWLFPGVRTVIDIGGQDSKGIKTQNGVVKNFVLNNKCAAGTGRYLELMAEVLELEIEEIGRQSLMASRGADISSTCSIFARQEVVSKLSEGVDFKEILRGIHKAVANRICSMVRTIGIEEEVVLTGGGAKNIGLVKAFERKLGMSISVPHDPLITGALGAALIAEEELKDSLKRGHVLPKAKRVLAETSFFREEEIYDRESK
jgi:(R)-2-hydroxyacyl-CoA dehydratese activating ATPase